MEKQPEMKCAQCTFTSADSLLLDIHSAREHPVHHYKLLRGRAKKIMAPAPESVAPQVAQEGQDSIHQLQRANSDPDVIIDKCVPARAESGRSLQWAKCNLCGAQFIGKLGLAVHNKKRRGKCAAGEGNTGGKAQKSALGEMRQPISTPAENLTPMAETVTQPTEQGTITLNEQPKATKTFACDQCGKRFGSMKSVMAHARRAHALRYKCSQCSRSFATDKSLELHECNVRRKTSSQSDQAFKCSWCHKKFTKAVNLEKHTHFHTGQTPFACSQCSATFPHRSDLMTHLSRHDVSLPHVCSLCQWRFSTLNGLCRHFGRKHGGKKTGNQKPPNVAQARDVEGSSQPVEKDTISQKMQQKTGKSFACGQCGKHFDRKFCMLIHARRAHGLPYKCSQCSRSFMSNMRLVLHKRNVHQGTFTAQTFQCNWCGKSCGSKSSLETHMRVHTGEKPFQCNQCMETFAHGKSLFQHASRHDESLPHACTLCNWHYASQQGLRRHRNEKHPVPKLVTKQQTCKGVGCGRKFDSDGKLRRHVQLRHQVRHADKQRGSPALGSYECANCKQNFDNMSELTLHQWRECIRCPYPQCNTVIRHRSNMSRHIREVHKQG